MKALQWRAGMTIEEKIDGLCQFVSQKFLDINGRFDKTERS